MRMNADSAGRRFGRLINKLGLGMRAKLILIFLLAKVLPLVLVTLIAWRQFTVLGSLLREIAVDDSSVALNQSAVENIERMTTDAASRVAGFLYARDTDIRLLAGMEPSEENYRAFLAAKTGRLLEKGVWTLAGDGQSWVTDAPEPAPDAEGVSTNRENNDRDGFHYRTADQFQYADVPLYDEVTFVSPEGMELVKVVADASPKINFPLSAQKKDISRRENTYVKAETYFDAVKSLAPGEIYVSDVIGAYVRSNYIGMYTPDIVADAAKARGYDIPYDPQAQAYAGMENPNGQRFEGIVRWATPVTSEDGTLLGYVTFALNHDHIMEFVDHLTPMNERYVELPSAFEGNYAFIWDYKCRSICHPRHHSITGFDPETGDPEIPWLETSIYDEWQASGVARWTDFVRGWPLFDEQSRAKKPAPALTQAGLVGLDGRYLNNAPQCTGWMDLTKDGGSGSFYILWSGLYKLTTAAAIPYYTGQYAPSEDNGFSRRGFGIVTIGAGMEDFTRPATETAEKLDEAISDNMRDTFLKLFVTAAALIAMVVLIAILLASWLTDSITKLIHGISRFRAGERQFRFREPVKDEFGTLADSFDDMADSVVDSVKNALSIIDMDHIIIYMNEYGLALCHMTLEEAAGTSYTDSSVYPAGSPYDPILALENGREAEIFFDESSGRYIKGTASYFLSKEGKRIGYIIETADVTDMVLEQLKIESQRTLLDKIFSASPDLIWYMNAKGAYLAVNPRFAAIAGRPVADFIGRTAEEVLPAALAGSFSANDRAAAASDVPLYTEERIAFADGHEEILDSVRTPLTDSAGAFVGLLGFARNVDARVAIESELRHTQIELEKAVSDANRANEHKGEFLARMSHEIRTPMNAIIGLTSIVQKRLREIDHGISAARDIESNVNQIDASSQHLLGLLNDILDISKIEAGKIDLTEEVVDLPKLAATVVGIIRPRCDEKNITFLTRFDTFAPPTFLSDSLRLRQVLINLLGNAVKFTPECGTVEFRMEKREQRDGRTLVGFTVRDTGIGISGEAQRNIFEPFEQGGGGVSRRYGGTGLGLAISQRIVELLGGQIRLRSELGAGSEFSFDLWLTEAASDLPDEAEISDATGKFAGKRMLLVDDVEINRMIVMAMLENTGLRIDEADDGEAAVERFAASPEDTYDMILMDVQMPKMDGYEASKAIRALNRHDARAVPIIALTANAFKEDIDRAIACGMSAHIAKPVEMETLLEALFRFLGVAR